MNFFKKCAIVVIFTAGFAILFYPSISNLLASKNHSKAIQVYDLTVDQLTQIEIKQQFQLAEEYHKSYMNTGVIDPFALSAQHVLPENYTSILNVHGTMGYIEIPSIEVNLPIYHTTSSEVLKKGVGHLETTSFPIGKVGGHPVLTAHRGLPSAKLFTDLTLLEIKDQFLIHILDQVYAYEVDQILTVEPNETEALQPVLDQDYVTLVTCTPYAINSHRLLVRGVRTSYDPEQIESLSLNQKNSTIFMWACVGLGSAASICGVLTGRRIVGRKKYK